MEPNDSYLECKRCFYRCNKKSNMLKHLDKKNLCVRILESYKYNDDDLYDLSLHRIKNNIKTFTCINCNKIFSNNNNLKRHIEKSCKKNINSNTYMASDDKKSNHLESDDKNIPIEESEILDSINESIKFGNNININNINGNNNNVNNINNNINININLTKSFDEEWDLSKIDVHKKIILLLNNCKFTSTLENILENEVNLNVLIDNTNDTGIVYANNKLINMNVKEIVKKTMDKLYKHLNDMHNDVMNPNTFNLSNNVFSIELEKMNSKYSDFIKSKDEQIKCKQYITDIYKKNNNNTLSHIEKTGY